MSAIEDDALWIEAEIEAELAKLSDADLDLNDIEQNEDDGLLTTVSLLTADGDAWSSEEVSPIKNQLHDPTDESNVRYF